LGENLLRKFFSKLAKNRPGIEGKETLVTEGVKVSGEENQLLGLLLVAKDDKK
jgi:hypothetical protein